MSMKYPLQHVMSIKSYRFILWYLMVPIFGVNVNLSLVTEDEYAEVLVKN
jgi:hypothetical protein